LILEPVVALDVTARVASLGALVAGLETIAVRHEFEPGGVFGPARVAGVCSSGDIRPMQRHVGPVAMLVLSTVGYLCVAAFGPFPVWGRIALAVSLAFRFLLRRQRLLGGDGAEQLTTLTLTAALLAVVPVPSERRVQIAVAFVAMQLMLSYTTAGVAKLLSPVWRRGDALAGILDTETYGHPAARAVLHRFPSVGAVLGWLVITFECGFPLLLVGPPWLAVGAVAVGLAFHVGCAVVMGLNSFLWAFPATYPCALVLGAWLSPFAPR
jgi:hypothetical protein